MTTPVSPGVRPTVRLAAGLALALWLAPVLAAGASAFGLGAAPAVSIGIALAAAVAWRAAPPLASALQPALGEAPWVRVAALVIAAGAVAQIGRLSVFMADASRPEFSVSPEDPFRLVHSCSSSYAEGVRFAGLRADIYDAALYQPRFIGPLRVDSYHYPPPFLLLPAAVRALAKDFLDFRALWFALQALVLAGVALAVGVWTGGRAGAWSVLGTALLLAMPPVIFSLQQGNFQITAVPLGVLALILLSTSRVRAGAALLAYAAAAKIFPGILGVWLLARRSWRAAAWTAALGVALLALTLLAFGPDPFRSFLQHELPQISDGRAFPHAELPTHAAANLSVYGLTVRLRHLGADRLDRVAGLRLASLYGAAVAALAAWAGWRWRTGLAGSGDRLALVQCTLALLTLASFRSPFVGAGYGMVSTLWLMALLAGDGTSGRPAVWLAAIAGLAAAFMLTPSPAFPPSDPVLVASGVLFVLLLALNLWTVLRAARAPQRGLDRDVAPVVR